MENSSSDTPWMTFFFRSSGVGVIMLRTKCILAPPSPAASVSDELKWPESASLASSCSRLAHRDLAPARLLVLLLDAPAAPDMDAESSPALSVSLFISAVIFLLSDTALSALSLAVVALVGDE